MMPTRSTEPSRPLDEIRAELDRIDDRIFALVVERAALANEVRRAKSDTGVAALRPAREAAMLHRLANRPRGSMELEQIWRLWRELIMANSRLQFPFTVDTVAASQHLELWDLGRSHFCFETPMIAHDSAVLALEAARADRTHVALLPGRDRTWWNDLSAVPDALRVFTALPMIAGTDAPAPHAFAVGDVTVAPTGADITVVHLVADGTASPRDALTDCGYEVRYLLEHDGCVLAGLDGFAPGAERAPLPLEQSRIAAPVTVIGAHAAAITPATLHTANGDTP